MASPLARGEAAPPRHHEAFNSRSLTGALLSAAGEGQGDSPQYFAHVRIPTWKLYHRRVDLFQAVRLRGMHTKTSSRRAYFCRDNLSRVSQRAFLRAKASRRTAQQWSLTGRGGGCSVINPASETSTTASANPIVAVGHRCSTAVAAAPAPAASQPWRQEKEKLRVAPAAIFPLRCWFSALCRLFPRARGRLGSLVWCCAMVSQSPRCSSSFAPTSSLQIRPQRQAMRLHKLSE